MVVIVVLTLSDGEMMMVNIDDIVKEQSVSKSERREYIKQKITKYVRRQVRSEGLSRYPMP